MTTIAWRWCWPSVNSELLVSHMVAKVLCSNRQPIFGVEKGGQLFIDPNRPEGLVLDLATPPHEADRSGRFWLVLDGERCQEEIEKANTQGLRLIGYWHTHPQYFPKLSPQDIASFSKFASRNNRDLPCPIAIIVGKSRKPEGIKAWSFRDERCIEGIWVK